MSIELAKKNLIDLTKKATTVVQSVGLGSQTAKVAAAFDVSGSMTGRYNSGEVQNTSDRNLALAINFDDNHAIDMFAFDSKGYSIGEVSEENFYGFVKAHIQPLVGGGTSYAPIMKMILAHYGIILDNEPTPTPLVQKKKGLGKWFGKKEVAPVVTPPTVKPPKEPLDEPIFVIFTTDGDCWDHEEAERIIRESSHYGVFWKFVGIGHDQFTFLSKLDDLPGRLIDNANLLEIKDVSGISEEDLYKGLLKEFPEWIVEARKHNLIK